MAAKSWRSCSRARFGRANASMGESSIQLPGPRTPSGRGDGASVATMMHAASAIAPAVIDPAACKASPSPSATPLARPRRRGERGTRPRPRRRRAVHPYRAATVARASPSSARRQVRSVDDSSSAFAAARRACSTGEASTP